MPLAVPGLGHGGVPRADGARRRQLSGDPGAAAGHGDADPRADAAAAALPPPGGQHGEEFNSEGQNLCCPRLQVKEPRVGRWWGFFLAQFSVGVKADGGVM